MCSGEYERLGSSKDGWKTTSETFTLDVLDSFANCDSRDETATTTKQDMINMLDILMRPPQELYHLMVGIFTPDVLDSFAMASLFSTANYFLTNARDYADNCADVTDDKYMADFRRGRYNDSLFDLLLSTIDRINSNRNTRGEDSTQRRRKDDQRDRSLDDLFARHRGRGDDDGRNRRTGRRVGEVRGRGRESRTRRTDYEGGHFTDDDDRVTDSGFHRRTKTDRPGRERARAGRVRPSTSASASATAPALCSSPSSSLSPSPSPPPVESVCPRRSSSSARRQRSPSRSRSRQPIAPAAASEASAAKRKSKASSSTARKSSAEASSSYLSASNVASKSLKTISFVCSCGRSAEKKRG